MHRLLASIALAAVPLAAIGGLPPLPEPVTSFGAAKSDGFIYVYGGHTGAAHSYSVAEQSGAFHRLDLANPTRWEELASGPKLQSPGLAAHDGKVYRVGGFTAMNAEGEEHDLRSQDGVAVFDPATRAWENLTPLPEPRSSADVAVVGDRIYVVGGWRLHDGSEEEWHTTAWSADLTQRPLTWDALPSPPFRRRAVALASHQDKLFVIGGMTEEGTTRRVDVFDPKSGSWSRGPDLLGERSLDGFGAAACEYGGRLYASSLAGTVQRLSSDGSKWEVATPLEPARFFHEMLPADGGVIVVGGANMSIGKITETTLIPIAAESK